MITSLGRLGKVKAAVIAGIVIAVIVIAAIAYYATIGLAPKPAPGAPATPAAPAKKKIIVIGTTDPVVHLDPRFAYEFMSCQVVYNVFDTLVRYDYKTGRFIPWLAERWEIVDREGKVWRFYLRKGVKFHDGSELTAEDVVYTIKSAIEMSTEPSWMLKMVIEDVRAVDKYTVEFKVKIPSLLLPVLSFTVAAPVPKHVAEKLGKEFDLKPVGTGPFKVVEFKPDQYLVLEKFDDYWNKEAMPKVDKIIIRFFKSSEALRLALERGEIDIVYRHLRIEDYEDLAKNPEYIVIKGEPPFIRYLVIATEKVPDVRVRQAIAYLIHTIAVPKIVNDVFKGYAKPLYSMVTPVLKTYYVPVFKKYALASEEEAIKKARELLAAAGYNETHKLKLVLGYTVDHYGPLESYVAKVIEEALEKSGVIDVDVVGEEWATYIEHFEKARKFDIFLLGWYPDYLDPDNYLTYFLHSEHDKWTTRYKNPEVDKLLEEAARETNITRRVELYRRVQEIMAEDVPVIPMWIPIYEYTVVAHKYVKGLELDPSGVLWFYKLDIAK